MWFITLDRCSALYPAPTRPFDAYTHDEIDSKRELIIPFPIMQTAGICCTSLTRAHGQTDALL